MDNRYLFTSESVTEGHPDKLCDRIADGILDAYLRRDPTARVACEVTAARGMILRAGSDYIVCCSGYPNHCAPCCPRDGICR